MKKYSQLRSNNIIVKCILGIIILSLIFTTINSYINQDTEKYIAIVNGEKISLKLFQHAYFIETEKQKKILGKNFHKLNKNKFFIENTYNYIISQLINNVLLEQYTKKMHLQVNNSQIKKIILNSSIFQKDKKFNKEKYYNYLESINLTNNEYINILKKKINTENLIYIIANSNFILSKETDNIIKFLSQKRVIKKSIFKINSIVNKQNVTNKEAQNFFYKYQKNFYTPEKFKISFVNLKKDNFKVTCSKEEIHDWYLKNINKYFTQEKRKYSIIQTKNKNKALLMLSKLSNKPEVFSKIAKKESTDPLSSKKGGDIGWISLNSIPTIIKNANLNQKNQISNIIPFRNEFLIIKLDDILYKKQKNISEVYNTIQMEIKNKKSLDKYNNLQKNISNIITQHPNQFDLIIKKNHLPIQKTYWFDKYSVPQILNVPALKDVIFNKKILNKQDNFQPKLFFIKLKNHESFLINITNFQNKKIQTFKTVKNKIIHKLKFLKAIKEAKKISETIVSELKKGKKDLFNQFNLNFNDSESVSRYDTNNPITSIIFSLPHPKKNQKIYTVYQDRNKNFVIILLDKIYNQNLSEQEKKIIIKYLEKHNTEIIFNSFIKDLRAKSIIQYEKIKIK